MRPPRRFSVRLRAFHFCCDLPAAFVSSCGRGRFAFAALCPPCSLCRVSGRFSACRRCLRLLRCSRTPGRATRRASLHVRREHTRHPCIHRCSRPYRTAAPMRPVAAVAVRPRCPPRVVARAPGAHAVSVFPWAFALLSDGRPMRPVAAVAVRAVRRASLHVRWGHTRHPCVHRCSRPYRTAAPVHLVAAVAVRPRPPPYRRPFGLPVGRFFRCRSVGFWPLSVLPCLYYRPGGAALSMKSAI